MRGPAERFPLSRACQAQGYLAAILNRCFALSPIDALIGIKIGCGLRRQIPVRRDFDTITHLRTTGSLCCLAQRYTSSAPSLRIRTHMRMRVLLR